MSTEPPDDPPSGEGRPPATVSFGPYRMVQPALGSGGMGAVHRAFDTRKKDRLVAVKVLSAALSADEQFRMRFLREAEITASLSSPHVVSVHDYGSIDGRLFIDMQFVDGIDLAALIAGGGRLEPSRAVTIVEDVADALDAVHRSGYVHGDVTPSNLLVTSVATTEFVYLIDFGIARAATAAQGTTTIEAWGTSAYRSPEQIRQIPVDHRADVYALTCVLYECLTGRPAFPGPDFANAHLNRCPLRPSTASPELGAFDAVVARGLAKNPESRYRSAGELARASRAALDSRATFPQPTAMRTDWRRLGPSPTLTLTSSPGRGRRSSARSPLVAVLVLLAFLLTVLVFVLEDGVKELPGTIVELSGGGAHGVAAAADGRHVLVCQGLDPGSVATVDADTGALRSVVPVGKNPTAVVVSKDSRYAYVADSFSNSVSVVDVQRGDAAAEIQVGKGPASLAISPDGARLYVTNDASVSVIDTGRRAVVRSIDVGAGSRGVVITPDGHTLFVANRGSASISVVNGDSGAVEASIPVQWPSGLAISPDGSTVYATNDYYQSDLVTIVDVASRSVRGTMNIGGTPRLAAISVDGRAYFTNYGNPWLTVVDTLSRTVVTRIKIGYPPDGVAVAPDGKRLYVTHDAHQLSIFDVDRL